MNRVVLSSAGRQVADLLREEILTTQTDQDEWFVGSEYELMQRLGVSRPILRQASRMLEHEQLLDVRRGVHGGFYGRRPTFDVVTHTASLFLRSQGATYADLMRSQILISSGCARQAAELDDVNERRKAATWYDDHLPHGTAEVTGRTFFPICAGFHRLLATLTGNISLRLFVDVLLELARPVALDSFLDRTFISKTAEDHARVGQAILAGNPDLAAELMRVHLEVAVAWADERRPLEEWSRRTTTQDALVPSQQRAAEDATEIVTSARSATAVPPTRKARRKPSTSKAKQTG